MTEMSKAIVRVGHREYVLSTESALRIAELLADAEVYESKWHRDEGAVQSHYTYHVYDRAHDDKLQIEVVGESHYLMAKLAGVPTKD
jgi:hypothetical protein